MSCLDSLWREASPESSSELEQWQQVLRFRDELPKEAFWWPYKETEDLSRLVRSHLEDVVLRRASSARQDGEQESVARSQTRIRFGLPLVEATFVGRAAELKALDEALRVADRAVVSQAITGLGGVGKSPLAAHYVEAHCEEYDVVAWIRAEDRGISDLAELAYQIGEPLQDLSPTERADVALEWLANTEHSWLLVLDNVASPRDLTAALGQRSRTRDFPQPRRGAICTRACTRRARPLDRSRILDQGGRPTC